MHRIRERARSFRHAFALVREATPRGVAISLAIDIASAIANAALLVLAGRLLAQLADEAPWVDAAPNVIGAAVALAVTMAAGGLRTDVGRMAVEEVEAHTSVRVLDAAASVPYKSFDDADFHDRLRRAQESAEAQAWTIAQSTLALLRTVFDVGAVLVVLIFVSPLLTAIALLAYVPMFAVTTANTRALYAFSWDQTEADRKRSYIAEVLSRRDTAKEVRVFELLAPLGDQYGLLWQDRLRRIRDVVRRRATRSLVANLVSALIVAGALALVVWLTIDGRISLAEAGVGVIGVRQLGNGVGRANVSVDALHRGATYLADYHDFLAEADRLADDIRSGEGPASIDTIEFAGVEFAYPGHKNRALRGVDLQFRSGELTAVVGANGSGKSTLLGLLAGLYEPTGGVIRWDGVDLTEIGTTGHHRAVTALFQDFARFHLTVADNVAPGRAVGESSDRSDGDPATSTELTNALWHALALAGADGFVRGLPDQLDAQLGRGFTAGAELSIGQWQRLALARALFRSAPLMLLDEPASALDPLAEADLVGRLRQSCVDRCVIFVSHRFASVSQADRIIVLSDGAVIEDGSHHELLARDGTYAAMYRSQAEQFAP